MLEVDDLVDVGLFGGCGGGGDGVVLLGGGIGLLLNWFIIASVVISQRHLRQCHLPSITLFVTTHSKINLINYPLIHSQNHIINQLTLSPPYIY